MINDQLVQDVARLSRGAGERHHRRVCGRKTGQLALQRRLDEQPIVTPEVLVVGQYACQRDQEVLLGVDGPTTQLDAADVVALIHQVEECLDVVAHDVPPDEVHHAAEGFETFVIVCGRNRSEVSMQCRHNLGVGRRRDDLACLLALSPADPAVHHELTIVRQLVQHIGERTRSRLVPDQNVGAELVPLLVQYVELLPLPRFSGAEVDRGTETWRVAVLECSESCRSALQTIDDVDIILQVLSIATRMNPVTAHAEDNVPDCATLLEDAYQLIRPGSRNDFALVVCDQEATKRFRVDDSPENDISGRRLIESGTDNLDGITHRRTFRRWCASLHQQRDSFTIWK